MVILSQSKSSGGGKYGSEKNEPSTLYIEFYSINDSSIVVPANLI